MALVEGFTFSGFFLTYGLESCLNAIAGSIQVCLNAPTAIDLIQKGPLEEGLHHIKKAVERAKRNHVTEACQSLSKAIEKFEAAASQNEGTPKLISYFYAARCSECLEENDRDFKSHGVCKGDCDVFDREVLKSLQEIEHEALQSAIAGDAMAGGLIGLTGGAFCSLGVLHVAALTAPIMLAPPVGIPIAACWAVCGGVIGGLGNFQEASKKSAASLHIKIEPLDCTAQELREKISKRLPENSDENQG
ncbi:hypothetical protein N836_31680 [Leptolyngbya sp. Heron Island J]|uniref:hypothetical protein n=1 Tax=Leptolyngbya sp. Heron Island J TaxID=1385935 RepID=UPI0003B9E0D4|nr:hypothetical protein [Leptolyngbya sp. Heron Island J]ESA38503.1 hypothetical protein N836_31680 [Leptolyngbya sp. Heron Island J]